LDWIVAIASVVAAVGVIATLALVVGGGRPHPSAHLQADPSNGSLAGGVPAAVYTLYVWNNGAAPLTVSAALELRGRRIGGSLDGSSVPERKTIAVGGNEKWMLGVARFVNDGVDATKFTARIKYRWLLVPRSLIVGRGEHLSL
jgi:hypothetical protein